MAEEIFRSERTGDGAEFLQIHPLDSRYPVKTFFTARSGGCSTGNFSSLNMGFSTGDDRADVAENRRRIFDFIGKPGYCEAVPHQVHRAEIACIRADKGGLRSSGGGDPDGIVQEESQTGEKRACKLSFPDTDALITDAENVILTSLHADCIPVWLYDPERHAAGLVHAGWRGTRADIAAKTARKMCAEFGSALEDLLAFIGPGISRCCFEVGAEVAEEFAAMLGTEVFYGENGRYSIDDKNGKFHLDLKKINERLLQRAGLTKISATNYCTCCSEDLFYSYRRDRGVTGRMCAGIMLL